MSRTGITMYNRGTKGIRSVTSSKSSGGPLKYPHNDIPIEKFVQISIYEGAMADSIGAITDGISDIQSKLTAKIGAGGGSGGSSGGGSLIQNATSKISAGIDSLSSTTSSILSSGVDSMVSAGKSVFAETVKAISSNGMGNGSVSDHAKSYVADIMLPLPNEIQEAMQHDYEEQAGWAASIIENFDTTKGAMDKVTQAAGLVSKMTGSRSITFDRNRVSMYTSTAFRNITMTWTLVPNNQPESTSIHNIIKALKKYSSPESVSGKLLLKSPHFFRLKFGNALIDEALQFYEVVITDVTVEYAPGGSMEMNKDETPKSVTLSVTFKDREPKLMEDWDKGPPSATAPQKPSCSGGGSSQGGKSGTNTTSASSGQGNSSKTSAAGGNSEGKENTGKQQADAPKKTVDELRDVYNDSTRNPLSDMKPNDKLPAESDNPYNNFKSDNYDTYYDDNYHGK